MALSGTLRNVKISGMACVMPENRIANDSFIDRFGFDTVQKIDKMVGVLERRIAGAKQTASDFAYQSTLCLKKVGKWDPSDVDAILFVSQTPDYVLPATACVLHGRLGLKKDCLAFDVNLGCSGFVYGLFIASSLLQMPSVKRVLLCGGDCLSKLVSPLDKSAAMLFGDGGFAVVVDKVSIGDPMTYRFCTDGTSFKAIIAPGRMLAGRHPIGYLDFKDTQRSSSLNHHIHSSCEGIDRADEDLYMAGLDVFNFTINEVPALIKALMEDAHVSPEEVDYLVLHQANKFILKQIAMATGFSMKKVPLSIDRFGNTSVTTIPLTICDLATNNTIEIGTKKVLMAGFGVGLSWGAWVLDFDPSVCLPITYTSDYFNDGGLPSGL
jgi:3-oxoacyl-[acyl-carrier-protein] synthase-3